MTKLKNTKKGMAKKALSISLVAAMLATSNVPVWAAEFTDGTDAVVEAPVVEEFTAEAPVVEEAANTDISLTSIDSNYDVTFETEPGKFETNMEWGVGYPTTIKVTEKNGNALGLENLKVRWLNAAGLEDTPFGDTGAQFTINSNVASATITPNFPSANVGEGYKLQVYEVKDGNVINPVAESPVITVAKQEVTGTVDWSVPAGDASKVVRYTGKQLTEVPEKVATLGASDVAWTKDNASHSVTDPKMKFENFVVTGKDTINSNEYTKDTVVGEGNIISELYAGKINITFRVWRKPVANVDEAVKAELPKYTYEYTGSNIVVPGEKATITNKLSGEVVKDAAKDTTITAAVGNDKNVTIPVDMYTGTLVNFSEGDLTSEKDFNKNPYATAAKPAQPVNVVARDLSNTTNTKIVVSTVTQESLGDRKTISAANLKEFNLKMTDVDGDVITKDGVELVFENGATELEVENGGTYSVTVRPVAKNTNFTGSRTVTFKVVAHDINRGRFENETKFENADVTYTGEKQTLGLTDANFEKQLGKLIVPGIDTPLVAGTDFEKTITFGENINAGKGQIIITGKGSYAGSEKVIEFTIKQATASKVVVPEKVLYDSANLDGEDYIIETSVVSEFKQTNDLVANKEASYKLTVPAEDYKVERKIVAAKEADAPAAENKVDNYVQTKITLTKDKGNFEKGTVLYGYTKIANKAITESDIIMDKTTYTYNGAEITPEYKVVVGGVELEKGVDYTEVVTHNVNVGEATLTVTGKGEFDNTSVSKKFDIVAAQTSDVKVEADASSVVYNGKQWVGKSSDTTNKTTLKITLDGNDVSDQYVLVYPTSKTANINAGNGTVTLKPTKNNKNVIGEHTFNFTIAPAVLSGGELKAFDKNGTKLTIKNESFKYDGTAKTFAKTTYANAGITSPMKLTANDYEIIYADNVYGDKDSALDAAGTAHVLVVAKGNYKTGTTYTDASGNKIENVVLNETFKINKLGFYDEDITVENGSYKGGFDVEPEVVVTYKGKTLVKDKDYSLKFTDGQDRTQVTNGKTLDVEIVGKGGYRRMETGKAKWGIDKFDFANANILVSGTDAEPVVKVMNGNVLVDAKEYTLEVKDGKVTVTATADNKNYTGTQTVDIKHELEKPEMPVISGVEVVGNKATVILEGECEGATGYDFVISTNGQSSDKNRLVNKNVLTTETTFQYLQQGMYWAHCHAWKKVDGKKVFSTYSEAYPFSVTAITPDQPSVTSVKVSKNTVKVTYTKSTNATGYDLVLGKSVKKVNGEMRPVEYGKLVKKVYNGNTVTATFTKVPKGTYYVGLHAYNRTSENGKKVFSPWSNAKKVVVK